MSVINKMLRDLQQRRAHDTQSNRIGTPPPARPTHTVSAARLIYVILGIVTVAVAAWYAWQLFSAARQVGPAEVQSPIIAAVPAADQSLIELAEPSIAAEPAALAQAPDVQATPTEQLPANARMQTQQPESSPGDVPGLASAPGKAPSSPVEAGPLPAVSMPSEPVIEKLLPSVNDALLLLQQGDYAEAEQILLRRLQAKPGESDSVLALADTFLRQNQFNKALAILSSLAPSSRETERAALLSARSYMGLQRSDLAATVLDELAGGLRGVEWYGLRGAVYQSSSAHQLAVDHFGQASRLQPGNGRWLIGGAISLEALGRYDQAVSLYENAQMDMSLDASLRSFAREKQIQMQRHQNR